MAHSRFLLIFSLIFITIPSSQSLVFPKSFHKRLSAQHSSPKLNNNNNNNSSLTQADKSVDPHYLQACTAILKGYDNVNDDSSYEHYFAEWENSYSDATLLGYFGKNKGMVSKIFASSYSSGWNFDLIIYDGISIDQKAASVQIFDCDMTFDQTTATFTAINNSTFTVYYGENSRDLYETNIVGKFSISFVDTITNEPMSQFSPQETSLKGKSFKLSFVSTDGSFSFNTSTFSDTYMTTSDTIVAYAVVVVSLIIVAFSWYTEDMKGKVTYGTFQAFYGSASFILWWTFTQPSYYGLLFWVLILPALVNFIKFYPYMFGGLANPSDGAMIGSAFIIFVGFLNWIPIIWISLLPSLILWFPFLQKLRKMRYDPYYLTRFEVSNYLYVFLWMSYGYLYPRNFYRFGQHMTMIYVSLGSILFQFVVLFILEKIAQKRLNHQQPALLQEESMNNQEANQTSNDELAKRSESESSEDLESTPTPQKYTLYAKIKNIKHHQRKNVVFVNRL